MAAHTYGGTLNNPNQFKINGTQQRVERRPVLYQKIVTKVIYIDDKEACLWFPTLEYYNEHGHLLELTEPQLRKATIVYWIFDQNGESGPVYSKQGDMQRVNQYIDSSLQWLSHGFATNQVLMVGDIQPEIKEVPVPVPTVNWKLTMQVLGLMGVAALLSVLCIAPFVVSTLAR